MSDLLEKISACIQAGKVDLSSPYPPAMKGMPGAFELAQMVLQEGVSPGDILDNALIPAMEVVGNRFARREIFVPQMLLSAKAMTASMVHLRPFFQSGAAKRKGTFIIGTVSGDLHDIGKNLVAMMAEGSGWEIIDLGVDAGPDKFMDALQQHPDAAVGLSALLTTTMDNMQKIISVIKASYPSNKILVGGAPVTMDFCNKIGADHYSPDPQGAVNYLNSLTQ